MDELELLKKDWQKGNNTYPQLSYDDIYKMSHAKSSSIVKWIFYIGLGVFLFLIFIDLALKKVSFNSDLVSTESNTSYMVISIIGYIVLSYFIYKFYENYRLISSTDTTKQLIKRILKTRQNVKRFVIFQLLFIIIGTVYSLSFMLNNDPSSKHLIENASANGEVFQFYIGIILSTIIVLSIASGILLLFYYFTFGILLRRLDKNFKELKKLEV